MYWFYNLALRIASFLLGIIARYNPKVRLFLEGRSSTFPHLEAALRGINDILWVHTASLGEFEQGLPVVRKLREDYPGYKVLVTFFSPSGFEVRKNSSEADFVSYLPIDTPANVTRFLDLVSPAIAIFIKYEVWPNYFRELEERGIPLLLISAIFKKKQVYFKWYGSFMRRTLQRASAIHVQDDHSEALLQSVGIKKVTVSGDTRFDRVWEIRNRNNTLPFMEAFKTEKPCLVAGSTWPEDEVLLVAYINQAKNDLKYVLVPHDIREDHLQNLKNAIEKKVVRYSRITGNDIGDASVLLIDTVGLLTSIYSYADLAYVGGGFATGLHNTLEPAVFGIPVITGPRIAGFREAEDLFALKGLIVVNDPGSFSATLDSLLHNGPLRERTGRTCAAYVEKKQGATSRIMAQIHAYLKPPGQQNF